MPVPCNPSDSAVETVDAPLVHTLALMEVTWLGVEALACRTVAPALRAVAAGTLGLVESRRRPEIGRASGGNLDLVATNDVRA